MYTKSDLKLFLFLIVMAVLNVVVFKGVYNYMIKGPVRTTSLVIVGFNIFLFGMLFLIGINQNGKDKK